ncbi:hypothetical protein C3730_25060, partial [Salmonella enterica]
MTPTIYDIARVAGVSKDMSIAAKRTFSVKRFALKRDQERVACIMSVALLKDGISGFIKPDNFMQWSAINLPRQVRAATEMLIHEVHCYTAQSTALCCQPQTNSLRCIVLTLRWSCRSMTPTIYDIARVAGVSK